MIVSMRARNIDKPRKPISPAQASLVLLYVLIALSRQVARDIKTIWRLTEPR